MPCKNGSRFTKMLQRGLFAFSSLLLALSNARADERPNILFLFAEQHHPGILSPAGHPIVQTPSLQRLADEGVYFENGYTPTPLCIPARTTTILGRFSHDTGIVDNDNSVDRIGNQANLARNLRNAGYLTCHIGKTHLGTSFNDSVQRFDELGFEESIPTKGKNGAANNWPDDPYVQYQISQGVRDAFVADYNLRSTEGDCTVRPSILPVEHYHDNWISTQAKEWLQNYNDERPFYLSVNWVGPHVYRDPPGVYATMYDGIAMDDPIIDPLDTLVPDFILTQDRPWLSDTCIDDIRRAYYGIVTLIDDGIGDILQVLENRGMLDNTIIIYSADHGDMLGDHLMLYKQLMYESSVGVPFIVRYPPEFPANQRPKSMASLIDIAPTLIEMSGADPLPNMHGRSLVPILKGFRDDRTEVFSEMRNLRMYRNGDWKYINDPAWNMPQLFNLASDPNELNNRYLDEPVIVAQMQARLDTFTTDQKVYESPMIYEVDRRVSMKEGNSNIVLHASGLEGAINTHYAFELSHLETGDFDLRAVPILMDTRTWESLGMSADGSNLRFFTDDGTTPLKHHVESGLGTGHTLIWLKGGGLSATAEDTQRCYFTFISGDTVRTDDDTILTESYPFLNDNRLLLRLAANQLENHLDDGDAVTDWADPSPSGHTAVQSEPLNQPTYHGNHVSGLGVIAFDGSDFLTVNGTEGLGTGSYGSYILYQNPAPGSTPWQRLISARASINDNDYSDGVWHKVLDDPGTGIATPHTNPIIVENGRSASKSRANFTIGAKSLANSSDNFTGQIAEIILFSERITASNNPILFSDIEHYLKRKWGLLPRPAVNLIDAENLPGLTVFVDNAQANQIELIHDNRIVFTTPAYDGGELPKAVDVSVRLPDGTQLNLPNALTYIANSTLTNVYEGFDYPVVNYLGNGSGGFGWLGPWGGGNTVHGEVTGSSTLALASGSLSTPLGYERPVSGHSLGGSDGGTDAVRKLADAINLAEDGRLYFSFLIEGTDSSASASVGFYEQGSTSETAFSLGLDAGEVWLRSDDESASAGNVIVGMDYLLLGCLDTHASDNDILRLALYPTSSTINDLPTTWDATLEISASAVLDRLFVEIDDPNLCRIDEIRIARQFESMSTPTFYDWSGWRGYTGAGSVPSGDANGDGIVNIVAYGLHLETPQHMGENLPQSEITQMAENYLTLIFTRSVAADDLVFEVSYTDNLGDWAGNSPAWSSAIADNTYLLEQTDNGNGTETIKVRHPQPMDESPQFMRLSVSEK